ncbi:glycosyltransferase, partial [bacterium]|nr:glycosyltransferase [bacterium]
MVTVSVVIPVFNCEQYIGESIRSVLEQTYRNFEIIIVDGGSTDGTLDEIDRFRDNAALIRSKKGTALQKNLGVKAANGKFIAFLDADDFFLPEKLKITIKFLEKNPSLGLVY